MDRRQFLATTSSCSAHLMGLALFAPSMLQEILKPQKQEKKNIVAEEKWGRLEQVEEGVWVLISTPFGENGDFTTVCNGGIIAGDTGVLAIESFMQPEGAAWMANQALKLAGRWPTNVVSTHFHADHTGGHKGYYSDTQSPLLWLTESTRDAAEESFAERAKTAVKKKSDKKPDDNRFTNVELIDSAKGAVVDLGNRKVNLIPRSGHTASDITVELEEPKIVWSGDLFFNRMYPNYGDATPSRLNEYAKEMRDTKNTIFIPGHGPIADSEAVEKYQQFLNHVQKEATAAFESGAAFVEATKDYKLPKELSDWMIWSPENGKKAFAAWYRELEEERQKPKPGSNADKASKSEPENSKPQSNDGQN